jgi:hypothetical protein
MRRLLIHLLIGLIAFTVGVAAASILNGIFGPRAKSDGDRAVYVAPPPMPTEHHSCPSLKLRIPAPPEPPAAPVLPQPLKKTRIYLRRADGTVQVIELQTGLKTDAGSEIEVP